MDITIHPVSGANQQITTAYSKVRETFVPDPAQQPPEATVQVAAPVTAANTGNSTVSIASSAEEAARQAALSFKNVYAVSDQDFTIFKDASGKYITRYVSLRDGKVTYVPTPTLVKQLPGDYTTTTPHVAISA